MKRQSFSESTETYLKTVCELTCNNSPVPISAIAKRIGVSNVSATEMVHRMKKLELFDYRRYKGVKLTQKGQHRASLLIRSHRLWECFLADQLNQPWELVHQFACCLEHGTDPAVTEALAAFLGHPEHCPHGNPIPAADGSLPADSGLPLAKLELGQASVIKRIHPESTLLLSYLATRNLKPGVKLRVSEIAPFKGPITVKKGTQSHALGREIAKHIFVTLI
jgi:DtxR family Mn-dependent transcriptional regulator